MIIFNSYVKLPEGTRWYIPPNLSIHHVHVCALFFTCRSGYPPISDRTIRNPKTVYDMIYHIYLKESNVNNI